MPRLCNPNTRRASYRCVYVGCLTAVLLLPGIASAQTPSHSPQSNAAPSTAGSGSYPQASTSTSTFDDWVVRCETRPPAAKVCEVVQTISARNQQQQQSVIAEVVFGKITKTDPFKLIVQLPPGVYLPAGASVIVDDKTPAISASFTHCQQTCVAEAELKPEIIQMLRSKTKPEPARLEFDDGARHKVALALSLKGLPAALAARDQQTQ